MQHGNKTRGTAVLGGAGMVSLWGASSIVRSVQYGSISVVSTATATINAVNTANSVVMYLGMNTTDTSTATGRVQNNLVLTNTTTVTANSEDNVATKIMSFCVIEFEPGIVKSVQTANLQLTVTASTTATITAVNTAKTLLVWNNQRTTAGQNSDSYASETLTNSTTITLTAGSLLGGAVIRNQYTVLEFY